ncbi:hypothetical protein G7046_g1178 [Stylonectria norvegica]|nr:hypothetical protein G7046_g1178 [Stylonectria norvegica]
MTFMNPVIPGFNPDPTVCVVPASTSAPTTYFLSTSTFEFFPGCPIYTSTNLVDWKLIGHALTRRSQIEMRTVEPGAGSWASTLRYRVQEKRWYLANGIFQRYQPATDERIFPRGFYVWTDNIWDDSAWSNPVYFDNPGFDQDLFWDDDGKTYLSTTMRLAWRNPKSAKKDFAIHISEVELATGRTLTPPRVIRESPYGIAEGSHIIKRDGYYYLFTAEGGTEAGHQEWVFRSREGPYGPWEGQGKPLWYNGPTEEVQRTGHADIFQDGDGNWWAVLLGVRPVETQKDRYLEPQLGIRNIPRLVSTMLIVGFLGRETFLVKVDWSQDWPVFNGGKNITLKTEGKNFEQDRRRSDALIWNADLTRTSLELGWYQKNTPFKQCFSLVEKPGCLRLYGNCFNLSSPEAPAMLLRKQTGYTQTFRAKLEFDPRVRGYEAGAVLWWSRFSYASVGVVAKAATDGSISPWVVCREPDGKADVKEVAWVEAETFGEAAELVIHTHPTFYKLTITAAGKTTTFNVTVQDLAVTPPVGGSFTGTMFGIYSFGQGEPVLVPAEFSDIIFSSTIQREACRTTQEVKFNAGHPWNDGQQLEAKLNGARAQSTPNSATRLYRAATDERLKPSFPRNAQDRSTSGSSWGLDTGDGHEMNVACELRSAVPTVWLRLSEGPTGLDECAIEYIYIYAWMDLFSTRQSSNFFVNTATIMVRFVVALVIAFAGSILALPNPFPLLTDPSGDKNVGNGVGGQFITGACLSDADCGSGCCAVFNGGGICSGPAVSTAQGKEGCGFNGLGGAPPAVPDPELPTPGNGTANGTTPAVPSPGAGQQFITGPCLQDSECASGCCAGQTGSTTATCSAVLAAGDDGKTGCGFVGQAAKK